MGERKIKKKIEYKQLTIVLYDYKIEDPIFTESNIEAFDLNGNLLWRAENCPYRRYYDMQIDESSNVIEADDGGGMFYDIKIAKGRIIKSQLRK